jgi:Flp pilus assembly protein TadG
MSSPSTRPSRSQRARGSRGQALVEFALVIPIFLVLLIGLIEGGRYVFHSEILNHATREGARYGVIHGANSDCPSGPMADGSASCDPDGNNIRQAVLDATVGLVEAGELDVLAPTWTPNNNNRGSTITVSVQFTYLPIVPLFGPLTINAESSLVINN